MPKPRFNAYLAAPLFNDIERAFNLYMAAHLSDYVDVFVPQRDGKLLKRLVQTGRSLEEAREEVFRGDVKAIARCDIFIAVLDGRTIDEGVAFELGYARALGKICIGLKTDDRTLLPIGDNPMVEVGCHRICRSVEELTMFIETSFAERAGVYYP